MDQSIIEKDGKLVCRNGESFVLYHESLEISVAAKQLINFFYLISLSSNIFPSSAIYFEIGSHASITNINFQIFKLVETITPVYFCFREGRNDCIIIKCDV